MSKKIKKLGKGGMIALLCVAVAVIVAIVCIVIFAPSGKTKIDTETSLKEVLETTKMYTAEYTYNSIARVPIDPKKPIEEGNIKYYAKYKGTVKAGFDFDKIDVKKDKEENLIVVIPEIKIEDPIVNTDIECIFTNKKYDTEKTYAGVYNACCKDLKEKSKENETLMKTAIESAVESVKAMSKPFERQLEKEGKEIKVVYIDEYKEEK